MPRGAQHRGSEVRLICIILTEIVAIPGNWIRLCFILPDSSCPFRQKGYGGREELWVVPTTHASTLLQTSFCGPVFLYSVLEIRLYILLSKNQVLLVLLGQIILLIV
jgi:hypothetical protein